MLKPIHIEKFVSKVESYLSTKWCAETCPNATIADRVDMICDEVYDLLENISLSNCTNKASKMSFKTTKKIFVSNQKQVVSVLNKYLGGDVFGAFYDVKKWVENNFERLPIYRLDEKRIWYKMRCVDSYKVESFKAEDMFHLPYEKIDKVASFRYSIPGHPCLYMGRSIYICWEEKGRPQLEYANVMGIKANKKTNLLDLRLHREFSLDEEAIFHYFSILPILIACSCRTMKRDAKFIPEYIFPQILLSVISFSINSDKILYGTIYNSTHCDEKLDFGKNKSGCSECIAIPCRHQKARKKFCIDLINRFKSTAPQNWSLLKIQNPYIGSTTDNGDSICAGRDKNIFEILEEEISKLKFEKIPNSPSTMTIEVSEDLEPYIGNMILAGISQSIIDKNRI